MVEGPAGAPSPSITPVQQMVASSAGALLTTLFGEERKTTTKKHDYRKKPSLSLTEQIKRGIFISSVCSPFSITVSMCVSSAVALVCLCRCNLECVAIVMSLCVLLSLSNAFRCGEDQTAVPTGSGLQRYNSVLT